MPRLQRIITLFSLLLQLSIAFFSPEFVWAKATPSESNNSVGPNNDTKIEKPKWINDPYSECQEAIEICAVGEGIGAMESEANARRAIANIFETKIQGKKTFSKNTYQESKEDKNGTSRDYQGVSETSSSQLEEITEGILNGVTVKKKFQDSSAIYALAVLDKIKLQKELKQKIETIDEKLSSLINQNGRGVFYQLVKLDEKRELLNLRYQFVSNKAIPKVVSFDSISKKKEESKNNKVVVWINLDKESGAMDLVPLISKILQEHDYHILPPDHKSLLPYQLELGGKLQSEEQFLNVPGFKKYKFSLQLYFKRQDGTKVHTTEHSVFKDGRTTGQAYEGALSELRNHLQVNWDDISVE